MARLFWYLKVFGLQGVLLAFCAATMNKSVKLKIYNGLLRKWITVRTKTSDLAVFEKVIKNEEYALPANYHPKVIIDAGANIGVSTLYFAAKYPQAMVIAVEPDESNFRMLQTNTAGWNSIRSMKAAIWKESVSVNLSGEKNSDFQVNLDGYGGTVEGITFDELMNRFAVNYVDVMKIDIEGAEKEVFETAQTWIHKVGMIVIELHDRFKPGCSDTVRRATTSFESTWEHGENTFFMRGKNE